jgi:hypothetical protein
LIEKDGATVSEVERVLLWLPKSKPNGKNGFTWRTKVESAEYFRKKFDKIAGTASEELQKNPKLIESGEDRYNKALQRLREENARAGKPTNPPSPCQ